MRTYSIYNYSCGGISSLERAGIGDNSQGDRCNEGDAREHSGFKWLNWSRENELI